MLILSIKENYNFVLCGDSILKGVIYDQKKNRYVVSDGNFANIIQDKLNGVIHNAGRFGNTIVRGLKRFTNDVMNKKPDIVLIEFGGNDCDFKWEEIANNPQGNHEPNTNIDVFQETLISIITTLEEKNIVPILMTLPPLDADRYFKWISKGSKMFEENILYWLGGSVNKIYWWHERYNAAVMSVAEESKTRLLDIRSAFLKKMDYRQYLCIDGIHPNKEGHKIIADKILEYIKTDYAFILKNA